MKPGDAVLVEARRLPPQEDILAPDAGHALIEVTYTPSAAWPDRRSEAKMRVPLSAVHALPDEATRRRAAAIAKRFAIGYNLTTPEIDDQPGGMPTMKELKRDDHRVIALALRLLAGNAAEGKPAARSADREAR